MFYQLFQRWSESDRVRGIIEPWQFRPCHLPGFVCEWPALSVVSSQSRWPSVPPFHVGWIYPWICLWMWHVSILHQRLLTRSENSLYWSIFLISVKYFFLSKNVIHITWRFPESTLDIWIKNICTLLDLLIKFATIITLTHIYKYSLFLEFVGKWFFWNIYHSKSMHCMLQKELTYVC